MGYLFNVCKVAYKKLNVILDQTKNSVAFSFSKFQKKKGR